MEGDERGPIEGEKLMGTSPLPPFPLYDFHRYMLLVCIPGPLVFFGLPEMCLFLANNLDWADCKPMQAHP